MSRNNFAEGAEAGVVIGTEPASQRKSPPDEATRTLSNRLSWYLLVGLLGFAPLAFGAVEFWSIAIVELLAISLALTWVIGGVRRNRIQLRFNSLVWSAIGLQAWIMLQLVSRHTVDRSSTYEGLLLLMSYFLIFLVVSNEDWSLRWIRRLAFAIIAIGFIVAAFGIIQFFSWNGRLYWIRPLNIGTPFGPYVNHNHFAGLMEMTFPVALSLTFSRSLEKAWKALLIFSATVMGLATLVSFSRGGIISFALSLATLVYLLSLRRGRRPVMLAVGLLVTFVAVSLLWLSVEHIEKALTLKGLSQEASYVDRIRIAGDTLRVIRDHPFAGTGLGTFSLVIPGYTSWYTYLAIDKAHNDYLQLLSEVGLIGFSFAVLWTVGLFRSVLAMIKDKTHPFSPLRLGAFCGCFAILIHSLVDFNLQIPANATYFAVLAALATRQLHGRTQPLETF